MTDTVTTPEQDDAEAQALAAAQLGYEGKARAQAPAEPEVKTVPAQPLADSAQSSASDPDSEDEPNPPAAAQPSPIAATSAQLEDLKAQIRELKESGADAATVRKMYGDFGEMNRTLKQLTALQKTEAPAEDELAAAMRDAEEKAQEYPEIAGPLLKALKVLESRIGQPKAEPEAATPDKSTEAKPEVDPTLAVRIAREQAAIEALDEVHPDRHEINKSPEFQAWLKAKPPEYQKRVTTSWNPAVVAEPFTDFKAFKAAQKRKQERLEAATTEKGVPQSGPTTISDEEAARIGYERARKKRH